jgi:hypothetical protein
MFSNFLVIKTLDLDPDPALDPRIETNADPQHWKEGKKKIYKLSEQDFTEI